MRRFVIEKKEGMAVFLLADFIQVVDGVLYITENRDKGPELVGVFREYTACWEVDDALRARNAAESPLRCEVVALGGEYGEISMRCTKWAGHFGFHKFKGVDDE